MIKIRRKSLNIFIILGIILIIISVVSMIYTKYKEEVNREKALEVEMKLQEQARELDREKKRKSDLINIEKEKIKRRPDEISDNQLIGVVRIDKLGTLSLLYDFINWFRDS